jgi:hypothetical protein
VSVALVLMHAAWTAPPHAAPVQRFPRLIFPGQDIQAAVNAMPAGTAFLLRAGVYRMQSVRPKPGNTFTGEAGAVMSGARVVTGFTASGSVWIAIGQDAGRTIHGDCEPGYPRCGYPEDLFIDDQPQRHVDSVAAVVAGTWHFDRPAGRVYIGSDPTGRRVELSVTPAAFLPVADGVRIAGLIIEKYAVPAQDGAVSSLGVSNWTITRNEIRLNHGLGVRAGANARIIENRIHHNGQLGIGGGGSGVLVEGNEIAFNNTAHFDPEWEAGGAKFTFNTGLVVRGNRVHHNGGVGLWTDIDNVGTLYEGNTSEDNTRNGILHEISYSAVIRNNIVRRNGGAFSEWIWGAGILVSSSRDVEVAGNVVEGNGDGIGGVQQARGAGNQGAYALSNLWVHDNTVTVAGGWTGVVQDVGDRSVFLSRNNRFERNQYQLPAGSLSFAWMDGEYTDAGWRRFGQDVEGVFSPLTANMR